jgi:Reverse transcriptase (RNA-dependent DNA polymerase)
MMRGSNTDYFAIIVGHRKTKQAVERADQYRTNSCGQRFKKKTSAGWDLEVEWKDGSMSWLPLKELKEMNAVEVANYAIANRIDEEPAFDWWVKDVIKKKQCLIRASKSKHYMTGFKFGIRLPRTMEDAVQFDAEDKTTFWRDAIDKELNNVRVAFDIKDEGEQAPPGYKKIPIHWIFDIKMDFTRKARLVTGGHVTDPPVLQTYSLVVSRESVRIAFLLAALYDVDVIMSDVGNAYLNARTQEKVYTITGKEFGEYKN